MKGKRIFTFFTIASLITVVSLSDFSQQAKEPPTANRASKPVEASPSATENSIKKFPIGLFARFSFGIGYASNFERPDDNTDTFSTFPNTVTIPLDFNLGLHIAKFFTLFGSFAINNLILRRTHVVEVSGIDLCIVKCRTDQPRREEATNWDIGAGLGLYFLGSHLGFSITFEGYYSIFTSRFNNDALPTRQGQNTRGTGWGANFHVAVEVPIIKKKLILGVGFYFKYHQILFRNIDAGNYGFLYSTILGLMNQDGLLEPKKSIQIRCILCWGIYFCFYLSFWPLPS